MMLYALYFIYQKTIIENLTAFPYEQPLTQAKHIIRIQGIRISSIKTVSPVEVLASLILDLVPLGEQ